MKGGQIVKPEGLSKSEKCNFRRLCQLAKKRTGHFSFWHSCLKVEPVQEIIALGEPVLPLLLARLENTPGSHCWEVAAIAGIIEKFQLPKVPISIITRVNHDLEGFINAADHNRDILDWGRQQGYI